jgi:ribosomal protein S18 acetylase RimI-like enzyme
LDILNRRRIAGAWIRWGFVLIRELDASHAAGAVALWHSEGLTRPWNDPGADFARALREATSAVLGGFEQERLVATVMVGHDGHRGWVYYLAVASDRRRHGLGRALMATAERWLAERAVPKLNLMIRGDNAQAAGFYDALGYGRDDVVVMSKRLSFAP